ncbi:TOBE domain-containing protein [Ascidiimonas aurantiaca]|uniref:TOBE domain-containing protein n=1 Tax=Ascidiimonas aurantiaca TaxID=1685432 RepID=UPI0030EECCD1
MNILKGDITNRESAGHLTRVTIQVKGCEMKVLVIDTASAGYLQEKKDVTLYIKETEVILTEPNQIKTSIDNCFPGEVRQVDQGKLLSNLILGTPLGEVTSLIFTDVVNTLSLKKGSKVFVMIRSTDIMLSE